MKYEIKGCPTKQFKMTITSTVLFLKLMTVANPSKILTATKKTNTHITPMSANRTSLIRFNKMLWVVIKMS